MTPAKQFERLVHHYFAGTDVQVITKDRHDENALVLGAVIRFDWGEELRASDVVGFTERIRQSRPLAEITILAGMTPNPDCPDDDPDCESAHRQPRIVIRVTWPQSRTSAK